MTQTHRLFHFQHILVRVLLPVALGILSISTAFADPPDLTANGVIATIDRSETYNLGPTGLRGWIHITRTDGLTHGSNGTMTGESRQILVTVASAPANAVLAVDDVILGAIAANTGVVPQFSSDARKSFAAAISEAEKTGGGTLRVKRWRAGTTTDVNIPITIMGDYTATAPYSCPKSALILANARNKLVADLKADANFLWGDWKGSITAVALLASVQPGDPDYDTVQSRLQTHARNLAAAGPQPGSLPIWTWAYNGLFLAEYYLLTGDANVLPGIQSYTLKLAQSQSIYGTYGHGPAFPRTDGSGRRVATGYGPVNAAGIVANMAIFMGKKALVAGSQPVDPEINTAIQRGSDYFKFYVNKGSIPYGEHEPGTNGHTSNGKDPMCAVLFGLQSDHATETEYFARMTIASYNGREYGHTGQGFSYLWNALGANMGGTLATAEHLKPVRWHLDLSRRTDGSFAYDGAEQYGAGSTSDGTYLGASGYYGLNTTASYLLTYSLPLQRLYITGKRDAPANPTPLNLDASTVAQAIAAGNFKIDCPTFTTATLISSLSNYDPIVRHYAAIELGNRSATITPAELTTLRAMLTGTDANGRMGAAQALGLLQDSTALPTIVSLLNDPDIWVRAKAAVAIRAYPSATASAHRDPMMTSFIANATNPDVIDWNDPLQMGNGKLSMAVFGHGVNDGTPGNDIAAFTINAPKESLLYPALRAGLQQPDSYVRTGATQFAKNRLTLTDTQAIYPSVAHAAAYDTPADRMWSNASRADAIDLLANLKITDGIDLALSMLENPFDFQWGSHTSTFAALNGLASYGDAARYTLPTLKGYLTQWNPGAGEYPVLVSTIETIENATTAPPQSPGLCVANSQVVTTTGSTAITLTGSSPRGSFTYLNVTQPAHGTLTGTAPNLTYTPTGGYTGPDSFTFQTTDTLTNSTVATVGIIVGTAGNGLKGEYFDNANFTNLKLTRTDTQVNFDWGTGTPDASIGADTFSVRWSGVLLVPQTGNYTFSALTSDGVRLYINGQLVIDRFLDQSTRWTDSTPVYLTAGQYAEVYMEYYENTGSAVAKLKWTGPGFAGANGNFIPQAYLFDGIGIGNRPAYAFPQSLSTNQNTALPILLNGSGGTLSYTVLTQPTNGNITGTAPNLTYTPNSNFSGTDSFTFFVHNGTANSPPATVSINVQAGALTSFTWTDAVSGNWSDGTKWTPGLPAATGQPYYALNFTTAGTYTATHNLNNGFQLNQLNAAANVTLAGTQGVAFAANGGALPQLNQNGANEVRIDHPVSLQSTTTLGGSGGGTVFLNGVISGSGGIVKTSPATLRIAQNNSYSGGTTLHSGTLVMEDQKDSALGSGPVTLHGGTLHALRINTSNPIIAHGGRIWGDGGWGGSWSGPVTLNGNLTLFTHYYDRITLNGNITGTGGLIAEGDTVSFNSGNGVFLTGTNTYRGKTTVTSGMWLHCSHPAALGSGAVEISGNAKLDLNFTGTRSIASLTLDGVTKTPGTYGSTASNATHKNDTYFSGTGTVTVLQPTTTSLNLTTGSSPAASGSSLTFTAAVTGSSPTGNVEFFSGNTLLGTSALNGSFQAAFTTNQLAIGPHSITARYVGNSSNSPSNSEAIAVEITPAAPTAPTGLNATPGAANSSNISLSWTASGGATGYYVKRSTTSGGPYTILAYANGTTYQDTTVTPGISYYYVISAINAAGESTDSTQATALVPYVDVLTPNPMTWASVPAATSSSSITMTATTASAPSGVEYFFDETSGNPGGSDSGWQDSPTYTDTGLNPSTSYTYTAKARDKSAEQNETGSSSAASATTNPPAVRTVVWNVNIGNEITISDNFAGAAPENTPNSFWNSATTGTIAASTSYNLALKDSTNSATPATLTLTAPAGNDVGYADWAVVTGVELFSSWIKTNGNSTPFTMTIGGLTSGASYDLIVYSDWTWKGNDWFPVTQTIGSGLTGTVYLDQISSGSEGAVPNLVQDTDPTQNGAVEGNWIRITGLSPDASGYLAFSMGGRNSAFNGFQLIQMAPPPDNSPPTPNPMTWASVPAATSSDSITMTATTASDASGVEYYFDETSGNPGGTDSGWQSSPTYTDTGLNPSTIYTYTLKARDKSAEQNETGSSSAASVTTNPPAVPTVVWNVNIGDQIATSDNYAGAVTQANPIQWNSITTSSASALALKDSSGSTAGGITLDLTSNKNPGGTSLTSGDKIFLGWFGGAGAQSSITLRGLTIAKTYDILFYSDWYWKNGDSLPITQTAGTGLSGTFYLNRILDGADGTVPALTPDTNPANFTSGTGNTGNYCRIVGIVPDTEGKVSFRIGDGANSAFNGFQLIQTGDAAPRADILDFSLASNPPSIRNAVISDTDITLTVPYGTDVTNLAPTFTLWPGATCVPVSGTARNFTTPQTYTVTSSDSLVTKNYLVTVVAAPPLPEFTLTAPATWDGRATITAQPAISNLALLQANNGTNFTYTWSTSGLAVTHTTSAGVMSLTRSQGSGVLTITLTLNNGTENVTRSTTINVTEPATDPWLERTPGTTEKAVNGQFIARNPFTDNGIIHYNGTQSGTPDSVYLKVFQTPSGGSETLLARHEQALVSGTYTFAAPVPAGLFTYRVVYGTKTGTTDTDIATVTDLVCGDAYIIEGQSNALAIDNGEPQVDTSSPWIYTYTIAQGWVPAIAKPTSPNWDRKIGFWGMKMAQEIVASHQMPVCIINGAEGGTRIDQHQPNPANRTVGAGTYDIYANLLNRVIAAKLTHGIRGIFWHQGESDSSNSGPPLDPDHLFYEQNFLTMSSAWKQDFPNIQRYILFQVAPNPCSMGPFASEIREVQRRLPRLFSKMSIVGTIAIPGYEGCHYSKTGYENLAALVLPVVNRDFYDISSSSAVTSPNLVRVWFTNEARTSISLKFDQPMSWSSFSLPNWHLNDVSGQVISGSASGDTITLQLASAASADSTLDYVKDTWNFSESVSTLIYGVNAIPALTFADVPVSLPDTYIVSYNGNGSTGGNVPANQNKLHDINLTLATNTGGLVKTGFIFTGWNTTAEGTGTDYPAGSSYTANAPITLFAKWTPGADGTWLPTAAGPFNWSDSANWSGGTIASGVSRTVSFTPNITAAQTVNVDTPITIGNITFTDSTSSSHNLTISGENTLTLTRSNGSPVIDVTQSGRTLTISSQISGADGLQKNGAGTLTLSGNNDYTGITTVSAGGITVAHNNALGSTAAGSHTTIDTATNIPRISVSSGITTAENFTITGQTERSGGYASPLSGGTFSGTITLSGSGAIRLGGSNWTGTITQSTTSHRLVLVGTNTVSNAMTINGADLTIADGTTTLSAANGSGIGNTDIYNGTLKLGVTDAIRTDRDLSFPITTTARLDLNGKNQTIRGLINASGATREVYNGISSTTSTLTVGNGGGDYSFAGVIRNNLTGTGIVALTKTGTGTQTLTGANTYTGATTIQSGTLALTGASQATTAITFTGGSLGLNTGVTVTASSAAVNLTNGTIQVTGSTGAASYTLLTAASITGTPTLASPITGYTLQVVGGNQLRLVQTPFGQWAAASGLSDNNAASDANPDGDGLTNLQEFAFATNPSESRTGPIEFVPDGEVTKTGSPVLRGYTPPQGKPPYQAVFGRRKNHATAGIFYTAEFSANLSYWTPSSTDLTVLTVDVSHEIEVVAVPFPDKVPLSLGGTEVPPKFFRIRVATTP